MWIVVDKFGAAHYVWIIITKGNRQEVGSREARSMNRTLHEVKIANILGNFHRNSCYPEAMDGETNAAVQAVLRVFREPRNDDLRERMAAALFNFNVAEAGRQIGWCEDFPAAQDRDKWMRLADTALDVLEQPRAVQQ